MLLMSIIIVSIINNTILKNKYIELVSSINTKNYSDKQICIFEGRFCLSTFNFSKF